MSDTPASADFIPGLGAFTPLRAAWALFLLVGTGVGVWCFAQQMIHGDIVTNLRTVGSGGAGWGLYIVFYVVFIGVSFAGITVAALVRLFGLEELKPLARMAELLTIVSLLVGAAAVLADLGRPLAGLMNLPKYARPSSPFFGTFTMVIGGYLFASLVYFFLSGRPDAAHMAQRPGPWLLRVFYRVWASGFSGTPKEYARHFEASFWLSLFILPLLVTAHSTLGFIFGIQGGRPGWFSPLQAPSFVVAAGVSGIGVLIVIAATLRKTLKLESVIGVPAFRWLGNFLWVLIIVLLYFIIAEELTASYASGAKERAYTHEIVAGAYRHLFLIEVGSFVVALAILFLQFAAQKTIIGLTVTAGGLVNVGAILKRHLLVVPSQTHGMHLAWPEGHYTPSAIEIGVIVGLCCLGALMYSVFIWIFPIIPGRHEEPVVGESLGRLRLVLTFVVLAVGVGIATAGFAISNRAGTRDFMDPIVPFSPVIFIVGLMMIFGSAVVYELLPSRKSPTT